MRSSTSYKRVLLFYMQMIFIPHKKQKYGHPRSVTGIALLYYMKMMFVTDRKHIYGPPQPVMGIVLIFTL
jgi:hypothetical protein